jgi:TRAP-type C4-dicarboxylate transport system permease small subunit
MGGAKLAAMILIIAGALALAYGGFTYTKQTTAVNIGPIELNVKEKKTVNIPIWAGIASIVIGGVLLASGGKRS